MQSDKLPAEEMQYFTLDLFPANYVLALDRSLNILSLLACIQHQPRLLVQQRFVGREQELLLALLSSYPELVPYEVLHVSLYRGFASLSEQAVLGAKQRLDMLRIGQGLWTAGLKPLRNVMDMVRWHLREFGLDAACTAEAGYVLIGRELHRAELRLVNHD